MSDRDSDEDVGSYFQAFKTVAPLQLPSIPNADDTTDTDSGSDDSEVPDIVFSNINWDDGAIGPAPERRENFAASAVSILPDTAPTADPDYIAASNIEARDREEEDGQPKCNFDEQAPLQPDAGVRWLSGAAGRLADFSTPRKRGAQDAPARGTSQVAATCAQEGASGAAHPGTSSEQVAAEEAALSQRFHDIVSATTHDEPPAATSSFTLEDSVGGVSAGDLDGLLAMLRAGAVMDLDRTRPADLPDPSTLFTDSDDEAPGPSRLPPSHPVPAPKPRPVLTSPRQPPPATAPTPLKPDVAPPPPVSQQPGAPPGAAMPAKFKKFGMPGMSMGAAAPATPLGPAEGTGTHAVRSGPVVQDLRPSIAESLVKQQEAKAAAEAKAVAAARVVASHGDSATLGAGSTDSDDEDLMAMRQRVKAVTTMPSVPPHATTPATGASNALGAAAPQAQKTSHTIAVGGDEPMSDPGLATGARKSMFVSTADLPLTSPPCDTRSLFVGCRQLDSSSSEDSSDDEMPIFVTAERGYATAVSTGRMIGSGNATAVAVMTNSAVGTAASTQPTATVAASAGKVVATAVASTAAGTAGHSSHAPPQMASINFDTEEGDGSNTGPSSYSAPASAPGRSVDKGAKRVAAGMRIKLPPGPLTEVPCPETATAGTQADAATTLTRSPAPAPAAAKAAGGHAMGPQAVATSSAAAAQSSTLLQTLPKAAGFPANSAASSSSTMPKLAVTAGKGVTAPEPGSQAASDPRSPKPAPSAAPVTPAVPHRLQLPRLPPWIPESACFTVMFTSPDDMPTHAVAAAAEWVLSQSAANAAPRAPHTPSLPGTVHAAFSPVSMLMVGLPPGHRLLKSVPAAAASAGTQTGGIVRVLAVVCTPGNIHPDMVRVEDVGGAGDALDRAVHAVHTALSQLTWGTLLDAHPCGCMQHTPSSIKGSVGSPQADGLSAWVMCVEGAKVLSELPVENDIPGAATSFTPAAPAAVAGGKTTPTASPRGSFKMSIPVKIPHGSELVVTSISRGAATDTKTLHTVLSRAVAMGLSLAGLQVFYALDDTAAFIATRTPHRPLAFTGCAALAFVGRSDACARWQAQIGPPDPDVARKAEPHSLHALLRGSEHRLVGCSTDDQGAIKEAAMLLGAAVSTSQRAPAPAGGVVGVPSAPAAVDRPSAMQPLAPVEPSSHWLAFKAVTGADITRALWALHHLAWCGFTLRGQQRTSLSPDQLVAVSATNDVPSALSAAAASGAPLLVVELSKEECSAQLPVALQRLRALRDVPLPDVSALGVNRKAAGSGSSATSLRGGMLPSPVTSPSPSTQEHGVAAKLIVCGATAVESEVLRQVAVSGARGAAPSAAAAQQLLAEAAKQRPGQQLPGSCTSSAAAHRDIDELLVVAVQGKATHDMLLLAMELLRFPGSGLLAGLCVSTVEGGDAGPGSSRELSARVELAAVRMVRPVPPDVARYLTTCVDVNAEPAGVASARLGWADAGVGAGSGAQASTAPVGRPAQLVPGQPTLLLALHGPDAHSHVAAAVNSWRALVRPAATGSGTQAGEGSYKPRQEGDVLQDAEAGLVHAMGPSGVQQYASVGTFHPPLVVAMTSNVADNRLLLAETFNATSQVALDPSFHSGLARPALPTPPPAAALHLLCTPHPFSTVLAVCMDPPPASADIAATLIGHHPTPTSASPAQLLPRLLKLVWREGFTVRAACMTSLSSAQVHALGAPQLEGRASVLVCLSRSHAVQHLHSLLAESGLGGAHVVSAPTSTSAATVIQSTWPGLGCREPGAGISGCAAKARKLVKDAKAGLAQATCMLMLPQKTDTDTQGGGGLAGGGIGVELDWGAAAEALDALRCDGFTLAGLQALRLAPSEVSEVARLFKLTPAQVATLTAAIAADQGSDCAHIAVVAVVRGNAVSHLQMRVHEASLPAAGALAGAASLQSISLAPMAGHMAVSQSGAAAEQQLLTFFDALHCTSQFSVAKKQ